MKLKNIFKRKVVFGWIAIILFLGMIGIHAEAAVLTSFTDTPTNHTAGASANHSIVFTTSSGAAEGETIAVTFASSFDTSTVDVGDIDLASGLTDRTLASDCSGAEEVGVNIASDVLTFTICPGDGGAIPASSSVTIQIGTNATSQAIGNSQIVNPPATGSYTITVGGTFGDRGAVALGIVASGSVTVGGTVSSGGTGGCPGCGGGGDVTAPVISAISVSSITQTGAVVTWTTDEISTSYVDYGLTVSYEVGTSGDASFLTGHSVSLNGLSSGTTYHYRVRSADASGNSASSIDLTFVTLSPPDTTAPVISDVQVLTTTGVSATIGWITNESATSNVDYGVTTGYTSGTVSDGSFLVTHSIVVTGLVSETTYHFRVRSADGSGNATTSGDFTFTTLDITAPVISGLAVSDITVSSARVSWTTSEAGSSVVNYGISTDYELGNVSSSALVTSHSISLVGLLVNTTYHIKAGSRDAVGNLGESSDLTFRTLPDTTPPANVSGFNATEISPGSIRLNWTNPIDPDFTGVRIVRRTDRFATTPTDGTNIFDGLNTEHNDTGLSALTNYRYTIFSYDASGNFSSGALAQVTTSAICGDSLCSVTENTVSCPADCRISTPACGNGLCEENETAVSCPADCGFTTSVCGNRICESGETSFSCPADCLAAGGAVCGNAMCEEGENSDICPADCPLVAVCGNLICESTESQDSCPTDCPIIEVPPQTVGGGEHLDVSDMHLLVANEQIELQPVGLNYDALVNSVLGVRINIDSLIREPQEVRFIFGDSAYLLSRSNSSYTTSIMTPSVVGNFPIILSVIYPDGTSDRIDAVVTVKPYGRVVSRLSDGQTIGVLNVLISIFDRNGNLWNASAFGELNPLFSGSNGLFGLYVPNGEYRLRFSKDGYREEENTVSVSNNIINPEILFISLPPPLVESIEDIFGAPISPQEKIIQVGDLIGQVTDYGYEIARRDVIDNPQVEKATNYAAPTLAVIATASAGAAASTVGIMGLLQFFFTQPAIFLARRKRRSWGMVYNAFTKMPVDLATVRLRDALTGKIIQTRVTDRQGKYFFIAKPGDYLIEASKSGFSFPSNYLKDKTSDSLFIDLYHGEQIKVTEKDATIAANIPMDPEVKEKTPAKIIRTIVLQKLERVVAVVSPIVAGAMVVISPTPTTIGLFVAQVIFYGVVRFAIRPKQPKGWGIVYDAKTKMPIERAIVRIFEPVYGKLLEMQITDNKGRYSFVVGPNLYRVGSEKQGYVPVTANIDYTNKKEAEAVKEDFHLNPEEKNKEDWRSEPV